MYFLKCIKIFIYDIIDKERYIIIENAIYEIK